MPILAAQLVAAVSVSGSQEAKRELESVGQKTKETEGGFKKFGETLKRGFELAGGMAAFEALGRGVDFFKEQLIDTVKVAMDHQQIMTQTATVLASVAANEQKAEAATRGHYVTVGLSATAHAALQKQLDAANYALLIATDRWDATKKHTKAALRGYLAAIRDFPHFKSWEESIAPAQSECEVLRSEVCCILSACGGDDAYYKLVTSAYCCFYRLATDASERLLTSAAMEVKRVSPHDAQTLTRHVFFDKDEVRAAIEQAYAEFLAAVG